MDSYTILVVEDDFDLRELLRYLLEKAGFSVVVAENGVAALRLLDSLEPDLILTDLMMPLVAGEQLITALRMQHTCANIPILVLTAFSHVFEEQALAAGATVVLKKPEDITRVVETVNQLLSKSAKRKGSP